MNSVSKLFLTSEPICLIWNFSSYTDSVHFEKKYNMQKWDSDGFSWHTGAH